MDERPPQPHDSSDDPPRRGLEYFRQSGEASVATPPTEPSCVQAVWLAVASLILPPLAIAAFVRAGYGLAEAGRSGRPGRRQAVLAIALAVLLPCLHGLVLWKAQYKSLSDVIACQADLRALGQLVLLYENEHPGSVGDDIDAVSRSNGQTAPTCVLARDGTKPFAGAPARTTYLLLPRRLRLGHIANSASTVLAVDLSMHARRDRRPLPISSTAMGMSRRWSWMMPGKPSSHQYQC